jgi:activator of HSP90 ATPase
MKESFTLEEHFKAKPEDIYKTWLSSEGHEKITGAGAEANDKEGEEFSAWDGYISGKNLELEDGRKIIQAWRTTEFAEDDEDSRLEIILEEEDGGTKVILKHSNIPEGQGDDYKQGWEDHYFSHMREYFK